MKMIEKRKMIVKKEPFHKQKNYICPDEVDVIFNAISKTKINKEHKKIGDCTSICLLQE